MATPLRGPFDNTSFLANLEQTANQVEPQPPAAGLSGPFDPRSTQASQPQTLEGFIQQQAPIAAGFLEEGTQQAVQLGQAATEQGIAGLQPFADTQAFQEQAALLGALGTEAQQAAISGIPVSPFEEEQNRVERRRLLRQAAARGRIGAGGTVGRLEELGGVQQARSIAERLGALSPLADISRGAASTISGLGEADLTRQAQLLAGLGLQQGQITLGSAADVVGARSTAAELAGLQDIAQGQQLSSAVGQGFNLAGQFFAPQPVTPFVPPPGTFIPAPQQQGFSSPISTPTFSTPTSLIA